MIRDIIWDFDGTLFDTYTETVDSFRKALLDNGIDEKNETILDYMKISESCAVLHFKSLYGLDDKFIDTYDSYKSSIKVEKLKPFPFAKDICRQIIESGGRNFILTHRGDSTLEILQYHEMLQYFTDVITKKYGFKRKPDPEGLVYLIDKYKIDKDTAMIVGDRECEILAGKAIGIKTCLYDTNNISYSEAPDFCIDSLRKLVNILFDE